MEAGHAMFAVSPKRDCPHVTEEIKSDIDTKFNMISGGE
jgi:hypothetical protein